MEDGLRLSTQLGLGRSSLMRDISELLDRTILVRRIIDLKPLSVILHPDSEAQVLYDASDNAYQPIEIFQIFATDLGAGVYGPPTVGP